MTHLESIHDYIAIESGSAFYAKRFVRALIRSTRSLESFPESGRLVPELPTQRFREVAHRGFRIVYRVNPRADVEILAVVHGARDFVRATEGLVRGPLG